MKKYFYSLVALFALTTAVNVLKAQSPDDRIGSDIPKFSFPELEGAHCTQYHFKAGNPTIVFYFDPECDHCQEQGKMINEQIDKFANVNFMFVAFSDMEKIGEYKRTIFPNVKRMYFYFCNDASYQFDKLFGYSQAPTLHIYNKSGKKVAVFRNEVSPEELLKLMQ